MKCPRCQDENPPGSNFCLGCGTRLGATCGACGNDLPAGSRFCNKCGTPVSGQSAGQVRFPSAESYTPKHLAERILTSKAAIEGERKQVTVLFSDLKGSMELLADRDPEEARKILDPVLELMMEAVHRYEGTVNQVMGDGIMALFGAPVAHEDHAVRGCYAALRMQRRVNLYADTIQRAGGTPVQIRVGLNSGQVVVRSIGSDLHMDYTAVGQTTHLAARMEQMAKPGSVLVTDDTLKLAEGYFQVSPLGPVTIKGLEPAIAVYELIGIGPARSRLQASASRGLTRFVGRDRELHQLTHALERTAAGHGQTVAVVGEAGVGKSRLVREFTRSHRTHDWLLLESGSVSYGRATPYLPVIDLLKAYFRIQDRDDQREIRERVAGKLVMLDRTLEPMLTPLLTLLDVPVADAAWDGLDPPQRRQRTLEAVKRLLLRESQVQPLLLVFEDLHWIDSETQSLLDGLVESLPTARVLLLVDYRPEYQHAWGGKSYYQQLRIDPLPPESAEQLLSALLGDGQDLESLKRLLIERAEGNPFFLEESVRTLVETETLIGERGGYRIAKGAAQWQIPATVHAILGARIDRLPPEDKRLLQAASIIGKDVPFALLQSIADDSEDSLRQKLGRLQRAEFLYETSLFPDLEYTFKHAFTHEVAYASVLQERRRTLHARIVDAIEALYPERLTEQVERLAHHAFRGEVWRNAATYLRQAGDKAAARAAHREAVGLFEHAVSSLGKLPETRDTIAAMADVQIALASALVGSKGAASPDVEASFVKAYEEASRLGDTTRLFPALWGQWFVAYGRGHYPAARALGEQLLAVAESDGDRGRLLEAHHSLWATLAAMGETVAAVSHCERGIALYDPARHASQAFVYGGHDPGACCRYHLARTYWVLGYPDRATSLIRDVLGLVEKLAHPLTAAIALSTTAFVKYQLGDADGARDDAERMVAIATAHEFSGWIDDGLVILACIGARQRADHVPLLELSERLTTERAPSTAWRRIMNLTLVAEALCEIGAVAKALAAMDAIAREHRDIGMAAEIWRVRGELLLRRDERDEGERHFREAIVVARQHSEKILELRATTSLGRLLARIGLREEAARELRAIYCWFTEGFETADLRAARALLAELGGAVDAGATA